MPPGSESQYFANQARKVFEESLRSGEISPLDIIKLVHLKEESLVAAMDAIGEERGLTEGEQQYLVFLINLRRYHFSWHDPRDEGSLWSVLGEREGPTVALVETSEKRKVGDFGSLAYSKSEFKGKYPGNLKGIFESMEEDEMTVKYTDEEYTGTYGLNFAAAFKIRRPSEEDEAEIASMMEAISAMIGMADPLSMSKEERAAGIDMESFLGAGERNVMEAYERLDPHEMSVLQKDLFEFVRRVRVLYNRWEQDGEPFSHFEEDDQKKMLRVDFGPSHEGGTPIMIPLTADSIRDSIEKSDDEGFKSMANDAIRLLEQDVVTEEVVVIVFYDEFMTSGHGYPFDMALALHQGAD